MNKRINFILLFSNIILLIFIILFMVLSNNISSMIFDNNIDSIVELKAETIDVGESYGTGVIISDDGLIITNYHIIHYTSLGEDILFDNLSIRFAKDNDYQEVALVKYDQELDLALLQINDNNKKYQSIKQGNNDYDYGDKVYAIGNTSNYGIGISEGIISVKEVEIENEGVNRLVIQSCLNISSGNSGGALLDKYGRLIGITTFRTKDLNGNIVYGFCYSIPLKIINEFIDK